MEMTWLVVEPPTPLKNDGRLKSHKIPWFPSPPSSKLLNVQGNIPNYPDFYAASIPMFGSLQVNFCAVVSLDGSMASLRSGRRRMV